MVDILEDVSILTTIPKKVLAKLIEKVQFAISDGVLEGVLAGKNIVDINIGIGTIYIQILENSIKYKFIPNETMEENVKHAIVNKENKLEKVLEDTLVEKIVNVYKDFL